jgi:hypothetical protein
MGGAQSRGALVDHRHPVGAIKSEYLKAPVTAWWEE